MAIKEKSLQNLTDQSACKRTYTVQEISDILGIGINQAYSLCKTSVFNTVRIGNRIVVSKTSFDNWLDRDNKN